MVEDLGGAILDLAVDRSKLTSGMAGAERETASTFDNMSAKAESFTSGLKAKIALASAAISAAAGLAFHSWHEGFEALRTQTGATGDELDDLMTSFNNVVGTVKASMGDIGQVMGYISQKTGLTGEALEDLTRKVIMLAEVTGADATQSVESLVKLMQSWNIETKDQAGALDLIYAAYQKTGTGIDVISESSLKARSLLEQLGFGFDESIALAAKFGGTFDQVFAGMKVALVKLSEDPAITDVPAAFQKLVEEIENAGSASEANSLAVELFGKRAGLQLATAIREGKLSVADFVAELHNSHDTIEQAHDDTLTLVDRLKMMKDHFIAVLGPATQWISTIAGIVPIVGPTIATIKGATLAIAGMSAATLMNTTVVVGMGVAWYGLVAIAGSAAAAIGILTLAVAAVVVGIAAWTMAYQSWRTAQEEHAKSVQASSGFLAAYAKNVASGIHTMDEWKEKVKQVIGAENLSLQEKKKLAAEADRLTGAIENGTLAAEAEEEAQGALGKQHRETARQAREQWAAELALAGGMLGVEGAAISATLAEEALGEAHDKIRDLEKRGKKGTDEYRDAKLDLRQATLGALQAEGALEEAVRSQAEELRNSGASRREAIDEIKEWGHRSGITKEQVRELIGRVDWLSRSLDEVPRSRTTRFHTPGLAEAIGMVDGFVGALNNIPGTKAVNIVATSGRHVAMATGGTIAEPIFGVGQHTGRTYSFGEDGLEDVVPRSGARDSGGITDAADVYNVFNVDQVILPNIKGAVQAEEFFDSLQQVVRQGV